jgi:hypothetical protein
VRGTDAAKDGRGGGEDAGVGKNGEDLACDVGCDVGSSLGNTGARERFARELRMEAPIRDEGENYPESSEHLDTSSSKSK